MGKLVPFSSILMLIALLSLRVDSSTSSVARSGAEWSALKAQLRVQTQQKESQVALNRNGISEQQLAAFTEAVAMLDDYQRFVRDEETRFSVASKAASATCVASLPKPLYAILEEADYDIGTCIGHMAEYGKQSVVDAEHELVEFNRIASVHPISAVKDLFLGQWYTADGVAELQSQLLEQMQLWDNESALEMYALKRRVHDEFEWLVGSPWYLCTKYGKEHIKGFFDQALSHLAECSD